MVPAVVVPSPQLMVAVKPPAVSARLPSIMWATTVFAKLIRLFFRIVLRPERELHVEYHAGTPLPSTMRYSGGVTHVLEQRVFGPLHRLTVRGSSTVRRLQNGSLQAYLAYALIGLVVLLALGR